MAKSRCETRLQGIIVVVFIKTNIHSKMMKTTTMIPSRRPPTGLFIKEESPTRSIENQKNTFSCVAVVYISPSYLLMPPFLCHCIDSLPCPAEHQCDENSKCVVDSLIPDKPHCVCLEGSRETDNGTCVSKLPYRNNTP